jgi:hypothetical protein
MRNGVAAYFRDLSAPCAKQIIQRLRNSLFAILKNREGYGKIIEAVERAGRSRAPVSLASEADAARIFADCAVGSLPPVPAAYELTAVMDDSLERCDDIYFEGGDHSSLVHLSGAGFHRLLGGVPHAHISVRNH